MSKIKQYLNTAHVVIASVGAGAQVLAAGTSADSKVHVAVAVVQLVATAALAAISTAQGEAVSK